jgi:hypothetical protein
LAERRRSQIEAKLNGRAEPFLTSGGIAESEIHLETELSTI